MATIDNGFVVGDKVVPESFNHHAKDKRPSTVVEEDGRYSMKVEYSDGTREWTHPYKWKLHKEQKIATEALAKLGADKTGEVK